MEAVGRRYVFGVYWIEVWLTVGADLCRRTMPTEENQKEKKRKFDTKQNVSTPPIIDNKKEVSSATMLLD